MRTGYYRSDDTYGALIYTEKLSENLVLGIDREFDTDKALLDGKYHPLIRFLVTLSDTEAPTELGLFETKALEEISATYKTDY
ncbi:hypothetical protein GGI23_003605 [Coemansia sp. RSA 2559]|nr:hypothetical protein GGI23_003605 [Coemansia sp. RSA 2559]KAJ2865289.1 hypothetical protein GGI22_001537 [Coemansia erecta]